jgi:hypothetical protein
MNSPIPGSIDPATCGIVDELNVQRNSVLSGLIFALAKYSLPK